MFVNKLNVVWEFKHEHSEECEADHGKYNTIGEEESKPYFILKNMQKVIYTFLTQKQ